MVASIADRILGLHGWTAALVVFAVPALEAAAFVGFVFPGEIAVLLGGVLAERHQLALPAALAAAILGAVLGDSVGYEIGKRYGRRLLDGTVGRLVRRRHLDRAERYLAERGGKAVLLGRFTTALRVLVPGLAGMSGMPYRTFLTYNAAGGIIWAVVFVLAGYLAGSSWRRVEHIAGRAGVVLALLAVLTVLVVATGRWIGRHRDGLALAARRQLDRPAVARLRQRHARQLAFLGRRFERGDAYGLSLTLALAALVALGWTFGALVQDVLAGDEAARLDAPTARWFADHREPWLTDTMRVVTTLGASAVVVPVALVVGAVLWHRRRDALALAYLAATYAGAELLFQAVKQLTHRDRPPASSAVGHFGGYSFPSGHATLAAAMWGAIAIAVGTTLWRSRRGALLTAAALVAVVVGVTRLYLGAHWLTDVLAGWVLGALWLTAATTVLPPSRRAAVRDDRRMQADLPPPSPRPTSGGPRPGTRR